MAQIYKKIKKEELENRKIVKLDELESSKIQIKLKNLVDYIKAKHG